MTLQDFINKHNGQALKTLPNSLPPQCFDLALGWTDNLGVPHYPNNPSPFPYVNAYQIYTDFGTWQGQYFDRIANDGVPKAGDLVVWSNSYGSAGHVAIATGKGDTNSFEAFSQNDPLYSVCAIKTYSYKSVLGWLRCKITQPTIPVDDCPAKLTQITAERDRLNKIIEGKDNEINTCNASLSSVTAEKNSLAVQLSEAQKQIEVYKVGYDTLPKMTEERDEL